MKRVINTKAKINVLDFSACTEVKIREVEISALFTLGLSEVPK